LRSDFGEGFSVGVGNFRESWIDRYQRQ
jgi:hypothetical protein